MNIFITFADPRLCAQSLDDKRVKQVLVDVARVLSTVSFSPYGTADPDHPVTKWAGQTKANYEWMVGLFTSLCNEYYYRFGQPHDVQRQGLGYIKARSNFPAGPRTAFPGPPHANVFTANRAMLGYVWETEKESPTWTNREQPDWAKPPE